jgi:hypothetical protein
MVEEREPAVLFGSFLFPRVFQTFRMSIQPTKLILAFIALVAICLAGYLMDSAPRLLQSLDPNAPSFGVVVKPDDGETELDVFVSADLRMTMEHIRLFGPEKARAGVFQTLWSFGSARFSQALSSLSQWKPKGIWDSICDCLMAPLWAITFHPVYSVLFFAIALAAVALSGGALCRITALQFARGEKPGLIESLRFSIDKFTNFATAPLIPMGIMAFFGFCIAVLGLLGNMRYVGEISVGLLLPLALLLAFPITIFLVGALAGFNLMFPSIAYEDSDGFDAVSRSFSYVYAQPWHMGFYTVIAFVYGAICYGFVRFFSLLILHVTRTFLQIGLLANGGKLERIWPMPPIDRFFGPAEVLPIGGAEQVGAFLIHIWVLALIGLMVSFVISFFFSSNTIIYALMRKRVDNTALSEVHTRSDEMAADRSAIEADIAELGAGPKRENRSPETVEAADK